MKDADCSARWSESAALPADHKWSLGGGEVFSSDSELTESKENKYIQARNAFYHRLL